LPIRGPSMRTRPSTRPMIMAYFSAAADDAAAAAMRSSGAYFVLSEKRDGMMYTPDMSRRARAVDLWATLLSLGKSGAAALVEHLCDMARLFARRLAAEGFAIPNDVVFNQVLAACPTPELTKATLAHLQESGECWCGGTIWNNAPPYGSASAPTSRRKRMSNDPYRHSSVRAKGTALE